jgi:hypothetical protein
MTGFIVTAPAADPEEAAIVSGPFWPNVAPASIRDAQRIDNTVPAERLRMALIEAIAHTNHQLRAWRETQIALGYVSLSAVQADKIDETSILEHRYLRAVGCLAKALLLERLRDFDATGKGDKKADALTDPIDDYRRDHLHALADIAGTARTVVELI